MLNNCSRIGRSGNRFRAVVVCRSILPDLNCLVASNETKNSGGDGFILAGNKSVSVVCLTANPIYCAEPFSSGRHISDNDC